MLLDLLCTIKQVFVFSFRLFGASKVTFFPTMYQNLSYLFPGIELDIRSETFGSNGVHIPPRSSIKIGNIEYHPNKNGHTVVIVDYRTGRVDSVRNFRTDIDLSAGASYGNFLNNIQSKYTN